MEEKCKHPGWYIPNPILCVIGNEVFASGQNGKLCPAKLKFKAVCNVSNHGCKATRNVYLTVSKIEYGEVIKTKSGLVTTPFFD